MVNSEKPQQPVRNGLLVSAATVVILAGMRAASSLLTPFLLAAFLAVVSLPPFLWLQRRKVPSGVAIVLISLIIAGIFTGVGFIFEDAVTGFSQNLPVYQQRLAAEQATVTAWLAQRGITVPESGVFADITPSAVMGFAGGALGQIANFLANGFLILLTVIFVLLEASTFSEKAKVVLKDQDNALQRFREIFLNVQRYMGLKAVTSLVTGSLIWVWLAVQGVDFAMLWGLIAFLLNFIPSVGSIIAAIPAVLLATAQLGPGPALITLLGYVIVNTLVGNVIEPALMGRGLGLSTLVVFVSLVFWGWMFGVIGMLLSVPLTMVLKIALESSSQTRWIATFLGGGK
jgi:AI-2 transport protein TqsA